METRFFLPVVAATALHAFVFLGIDWPHVPSSHAPRLVSQVIDCFPLIEDSDPVEQVEKSMDGSTEQSFGEPERLRPTLPEDAAPRMDDFLQLIEPKRRQPVMGVENLLHAPKVGLEGKDGPGIGIPSGWLDRAPRTRSQVAPSYPAAERSAGITGEVWVEFLVDEGGRVQHARVIRSSHVAFEPATLRAVERWRFEPGTQQGRSVKFRMVVPVQFRLESEH